MRCSALGVGVGGWVGRGGNRRLGEDEKLPDPSWEP